MPTSTVRPSHPQPVSGLVGTGFKREIQGLRAIAVLLVVVYHIWPATMPGGYVGVDVFFVISGYLITGLLLRELEREGRVSMVRFYARRIRRLLPAATAALVGVVVGSFFLMPEAYWRDTAIEVLASALYVQNWWLAFQAVDYLGAEAAASPVQHFWSLSVEEQFYLAWPWLLVAVGWGAARMGGNRLRMLSWLLLMVGGASLAHSVWLTHADRDFAYFATTTRVWELASGGGLAVLMLNWIPSQSQGRVLRAIGLVMVLLAAFLYTNETRFPGYAALLPVLGTALIILAGRDDRTFGLFGILSAKVSQFVGGISYSLYLWHWPVVVFYGYATGATPGLVHGGMLLLLAVVLAYGSKRFVEDPFLKARQPAPSWKPYILGAGCIALCGVAAAGQFAAVGLRQAPAPAIIASDGEPLGARVMQAGFPHPFVPSLEDAKKDLPDVDQRCQAGLKSEAPDVTCVFGPEGASHHLAVVGDSHAWHWVPALLDLAEPLDMKVHILTKSACPFTTATLVRKNGDYTACAVWNERVRVHLMATRPDVVFTSASGGVAARRVEGESNAEAVAKGFRELWEELLGSGIGVVAMRDTPRYQGDGRDAIACLSKRDKRPADCVVERSRAVRDEAKDPTALAAKDDPRVSYIDLTDQMCNKVACEPIVGGVLLWRDSHHMTATFARSLAPALRTPLEAALETSEQAKPRAQSSAGNTSPTAGASR